MVRSDLSEANYDTRFRWVCGEQEIVFDAADGAGATGDSPNLHYLGALVVIRPDTFIELALPLPEPTKRTTDYLPTIASTRGISPPALYLAEIAPFKAGSRTIRYAVVSHDGRHRARFIRRSCEWMPVQIVIQRLRASQWTPEVMESLRQGVVKEEAGGNVHRNPYLWTGLTFDLAYVNGERYKFSR